jgi:putative selenium metabolism hydrolase
LIFLKLIPKEKGILMDLTALKVFTESREDELVRFLRDLIEIKSFTGQEKEVVSRVEEEMKLTGFDEVFRDKIGNVVGRIGSGPRTIVFDAHLDVVAAERKGWDTDPFKAVVKEGRIYGRGAMDDKGPFASTLLAGRAIKALSLNRDFTIYIVGSISEEDCEGLALGSFLSEYEIDADYVVIAEASNLKICRGHRGRALLEARFEGRPVHASIHSQGDNPIERALPFAQALIDLDKRLPLDETLGQGDIVATGIESMSVSASTTPSLCRIIIDRRLTTLDTKESVLAELSSLPNADKGKIQLVNYREKSYNGFPKVAEEYFPAWVLPEENPLVQAGIKCYSDLFEEEPVVTVWGFSTNGNYTMGRAGIPTLGFGPGVEELAHSDNEYIAIKDMIKAAQFYSWLPVVLSGKKS